MTRQGHSNILLNGVTADTTSGGLVVGNAIKMSLMLTAASISAGNGVFTVEVSNDGGVTWIAYSRLLDNVTNTNAQNQTRVASKTLSSNTSVILFFDDADVFDQIRVKVDMTTDGVYSAILFTQTDG